MKRPWRRSRDRTTAAKQSRQRRAPLTDLVRTLATSAADSLSRIADPVRTLARLSLLFSLIWLAFAAALVFGWLSVRAEVEGSAHAEARLVVDAVSQRLGQAEKALAPKARLEAHALRAAAASRGAARLVADPVSGATRLVFGRADASTLRAGRANGAAALYVRRGDGFVLVAGPDAAGASGPGQIGSVEPSSQAAGRLRAGHPAAGPANLNGRVWYAAFEPIKDTHGNVIAAAGASYPLEAVDELTRLLANSPMFAHGFLAQSGADGAVLFGAPRGGLGANHFILTAAAATKSAPAVVAGVDRRDLELQVVRLVGGSASLITVVIVLAVSLAWLMARRLTASLAEAERSRKEAQAARGAAEAAGAALAAELKQAARYVESLLPARTRSGQVTADWLYRPSAEVGGDAFGYHWLDDTRFAFYLLDVCGHGVGAALLATTVMNVIRAKTVNADFTDPSSVLAALNGAFPMEAQDGMYFTIWYGVYDTLARRVRYAGGGHHPAVLITTGSVRLLPGRGAPIGCFPKVEYPAFDVDVPVGAQLYVFSDGLFEVEAKTRNQMLTFDDFVEIIVDWRQRRSDRELAYVLEAVQDIQGKAAFDDDCTLMELSFRPVGGEFRPKSATADSA